MIVAAGGGAFVQRADVAKRETADHAAAWAPGGGRDVEFGVEGLVLGRDFEWFFALGTGWGEHRKNKDFLFKA